VSKLASPPGQTLLLQGISWRTYLRLLRAFADRRLRLTYDRGALEIMTLSPEHERFKNLLGYLILVLVEELGWNMASFGSMTFQGRKRRRGLEPDQCYWIQNEPLVRCQDTIDLNRDPPPDLVVEIDISPSAMDRKAIYAALRVPEVWCFDGQSLRVQLLRADGQYGESQQSQAFSFLPPDDVLRFLQLRGSLSETEMLRQFPLWVRQRIAANWS
jgi:Uma2 family endonuclease